MSKKSAVVPDFLTMSGRPDYQRGWMIRNGRTKSVAVSTEKLAFMLVQFTREDAQMLRELIGEETCKAAIKQHTKKPVSANGSAKTDN